MFHVEQWCHYADIRQLCTSLCLSLHISVRYVPECCAPRYRALNVKFPLGRPHRACTHPVTKLPAERSLFTLLTVQLNGLIKKSHQAPSMLNRS